MPECEVDKVGDIVEAESQVLSKLIVHAAQVLKVKVMVIVIIIFTIIIITIISSTCSLSSPWGRKERLVQLGSRLQRAPTQGVH